MFTSRVGQLTSIDQLAPPETPTGTEVCMLALAAKAALLEEALEHTEAELIVEGADGSNELDKVAMKSSMGDLPSDCVFGDGGAYELLQQTPAPPAPVEASASSSTRTRTVPKLQLTGSFATMLAAAARVFAVGSGSAVVRLLDSVTENSKSTIAKVFASEESDASLLGTISTAEPLSTALGLKATCKSHKAKGTTCSCWIRFSSMKEVSSEDRLNLFKSLAEWLADGPTVDCTEHEQQSLAMRIVAGMNPRPKGPRPKTRS